MRPSVRVAGPSIPRGVRRAAVCRVLVVYFSWFPDAIRVFVSLNASWRDVVRSSHRYAIIKQVAAPRAGESVLPAAAQDGLALLRAHHVLAFNISQVAFEDVLLRQRLIEGAYPIRYAPEAPHILQLASESLVSGCSLIATQGGMALVRCS